MPDIEFHIDGPKDAHTTFLFAHGAGAAMDTPFMTQVAEGLADRGFRVARFEFAYMAARRSGGPKRPPPKMELLQAEYLAAVQALDCTGRLIIGGKSMGGRVASLIADSCLGQGPLTGLLCLGYPFHPSGKPAKLRTAHLADLQTPALICQGTRDPFGTQQEVAGYSLADVISLIWLEDGDHDLKPRKRLTGKSQQDHISAACDAIRHWSDGLA